MSQLENLDATLLASKKITDFLKMYSETQWPRILKATMILGIQELETNHCPNGALNTIFPKEIEDLVVKNEQDIIASQQKRVKAQEKAEREAASTQKSQ